MQIKNSITNLKNKGLFHIILGSSLAKMISFMSAFFLPRFLSKADYGLLSYIDTLNNYLLLINGFGIVNATLKYCSQDIEEGEKKGIFLFSLIFGVGIDVFILLATLIYYISVPLTFNNANKYLIMLSFIPILTFIYEDIQLLLRAMYENQKFSYISFLYTFFSVILQIIMAYFFALNGIVVARYVSVILCIIIGYYFIRNSIIIKSKSKFPNREKCLKIIKFSIVMMITNATSLVMTLNENMILTTVLNDELILADYKVASYILVVSLFLSQAIVTFVFPYFVRHSEDKIWVWNSFKKVSVVNAVIMIPLHVMLYLGTPMIIIILFGDKYISVIPIMRLLLIASLAQSVLRGLVGNILGGIGEERFNLKLNLVMVILHLFISYWSVKRYGINGSALALIFVYSISGIIMIGHLKKVCKKVNL